MKRDQRGWVYQEEQCIAALGFMGAVQLGVILGRSPGCIRKKASRLNYSVKRKSQITVTELSQEALDHLTKRAPRLICPACGLRLVINEKLGACPVCLKVALTDAHKEKLAELAAHRDYNVAKQQLRRERKKLGVAAPRTAKRKEAQGHEAHDSETE